MDTAQASSRLILVQRRAIGRGLVRVEGAAVGNDGDDFNFLRRFDLDVSSRFTSNLAALRRKEPRSKRRGNQLPSPPWARTQEFEAPGDLFSDRLEVAAGFVLRGKSGFQFLPFSQRTVRVTVGTLYGKTMR